MNPSSLKLVAPLALVASLLLPGLALAEAGPDPRLTLQSVHKARSATLIAEAAPRSCR